ncbi:MAG: hypothetical protein EG825_05880 [Rhodocyclaceae bacterium]|nr:hypothetical protein [Rhodocyclaceae bacterium]
MKVEVATAIQELSRQFPDAGVTPHEDGQGGAYVCIDSVALGPQYRPNRTWVGFHIPCTYPYADIYPVFIGAEVSRVSGIDFIAPITRGHQFEGRAAIQVSRRSGAASSGLQKATAKILKVLDFLEKAA